MLAFCHVASLPYTQMLLKHIEYVVIILNMFLNYNIFTDILELDIHVLL